MGSEPHSLRTDAQQILTASLQAVQPDAAVRRALQDLSPSGGRILLVAAGKAAWQMARAALDCLGRVDEGIVITKYGHVRGELPGVTCYEAGHPVPDENSFAATARATLDFPAPAGPSMATTISSPPTSECRARSRDRRPPRSADRRR